MRFLTPEQEARRATALEKRSRDAEGNPLCRDCSAVVGPDDFHCEPCNDAYRAKCEAEQQRKQLAWLLENNRACALGRLPEDWAWVNDDALFYEKIKLPKLRALADKYTLDAGSLIVRGKTGAGKTAAVRRAMDRLVRAATNRKDPIIGVLWTTAAQLVATRYLQKFGDGEPVLLVDARKAPVLVIDEFGFERHDPAFWTDLIDSRYPRGITIVTSGASLEELGERYGAATLRKLREPVGAILDIGD